MCDHVAIFSVVSNVCAMCEQCELLVMAIHQVKYLLKICIHIYNGNQKAHAVQAKKKKIQRNPALGPPRYNGHLVITATFFAAWQNGHSCKKKPSLIRSPVNVANFFCPLVTILTGLHCTAKEGLHEAPPKRQFKEYYGIFHSGQLLMRSKRWCSGKSTRLPPMLRGCKFR